MKWEILHLIITLNDNCYELLSVSHFTGFKQHHPAVSTVKGNYLKILPHNPLWLFRRIKILSYNTSNATAVQAHIPSCGQGRGTLHTYRHGVFMWQAACSIEFGAQHRHHQQLKKAQHIPWVARLLQAGWSESLPPPWHTHVCTRRYSKASRSYPSFCNNGSLFSVKTKRHPVDQSPPKLPF